MFITTKLYTRLFGKFVGHDHSGNRYFCLPAKKNREERRWVIYSGMAEASKVPAKWHLWLHHITNDLPSQSEAENYKWQKPHQPNFTATSKAYYPLSQEQKYSANLNS
jgi:NADH:ubiquinone oxidoreductase subunit